MGQMKTESTNIYVQFIERLLYEITRLKSSSVNLCVSNISQVVSPKSDKKIKVVLSLSALKQIFKGYYVVLNKNFLGCFQC